MENNKIPQHIAFIMDGNRRWAKANNKSSLEGHSAGYEIIEKTFLGLMDRGVKVVSFFAFSTENWNRSKTEVNYLMKLLKQAVKDKLKSITDQGYRVLISGRLDKLPGNLGKLCREIIEETKNNQRGILHICLNYGGQTEIVDAMKKIIKDKINPNKINETLIKRYLYQGELAYPDLIVRTSGEQRLSGFLLWQSAYSELLFLKKYWPDLNEKDLDNIICDYAQRQRRFGGN